MIYYRIGTKNVYGLGSSVAYEVFKIGFHSQSITLPKQDFWHFRVRFQRVAILLTPIVIDDLQVGKNVGGFCHSYLTPKRYLREIV